MDYAAATPVSKGAHEAQVKMREIFANPGAIHKDGVEAKTALEDARGQIGLFLGCRAREVIFTSGGTESNNLAILGHARFLEKERGTLADTNWITTKIEHPSVLECFKEISLLGGEVIFISPNEHGVITPDTLRANIKDSTVLVSVGWANSEIGTVQPLHDLSKIIKEKDSRIVFHTDAGQAPLYKPSIANGLGVDMISLDSGKLYGPRGIGALYKKSSVPVSPLFFGGAQEYGLRPGSENVSLAAGFAYALKEASEKREKETIRLERVRCVFIERITELIKGVVVNGEGKTNLPNVINVSIPDIDNEYITLALDNIGVSVSTKSSCLEGEEDISHVVDALGGGKWRAKNSIRFSFGSDTFEKDADYVAQKLSELTEEYKSLT